MPLYLYLAVNAYLMVAITAPWVIFGAQRRLPTAAASPKLLSAGTWLRS